MRTCSLCGKKKKTVPLDMEDPVFGAYVRLMRKLKLSKHSGDLGICKNCMKMYLLMKRTHNSKIVLYSVAAAISAIVYFYFTGNIFFSIIIGIFIVSWSVFSYCPPLR
ncbi:hypothetical protein JXA56_02385 [Candidatus Micrarchaeota archaeon]|nr:hypothetical protein [Candidatus Micrarchaeota archaeon]